MSHFERKISVDLEEQYDFKNRINSFLVKNFVLEGGDILAIFTDASGRGARVPGIIYKDTQKSGIEDIRDLYIKFGTFTSIDGILRKRIYISVIGFRKNEQLKKNGKKLLKILCDFALKYNCEVIEIENVNEKSERFAKKLGFSRVENTCNYLVEVHKLSSYFKLIGI